ncbi:MAG: hypothetical protein LBH82_06185, partial [Bacteroidales bacterium]|nr:hypothetical protein [Bacteroidales bacterium]
MKRNYAAIVLTCLFMGNVFAQNEMDAFRYAQLFPTGSARYTSLGGSMGGFGADFSVLSANNPAGIGLYKRSEFTFTPAVGYNKVTADYNGGSRTGSKYGFTLNNLGFVLTTPLTSSQWKSFQLATGYTNLARYRTYTHVKGANYTDADPSNPSSYFDWVASSMNGLHNSNITEDNLLEYYGWNSYPNTWDGGYLIDAVPGMNNQYRANNDYLDQKQTRLTEGYLNEYVFSGGANYDDKLYLGATLGIPFFRYNQYTTYTESKNFYYDSLIYYDEFQARAAGINLKIGLLYQPVKFMRFGAGFHTPTFYNNVRETYTSKIDVWNFFAADTLNYDLSVDDGVSEFKYQLVTPFHVLGNLAFLFDRYGFINVDYEYVNYSTSNLQAVDYDFDNENNNIKKYYQSTHSVRVGGELNLSPVALRLGYSYTSNPYKDVQKDGTVHAVSAGIGYKTRYFFLDFAYRYRFFKDKDVFYDAENLNPYNTKTVNQLFALT